MKVSLVLSAFKRPELLKLGLSSVLLNKPSFDLEVIVVNDGVLDDTESVCNSFRQKGLDVKYLFSGKRNLDGIMKSRVSGFALNIGIKQSSGDIIVLSCPEIYHLNNALEIIVTNLIASPRSMVIPDLLYFDKTSEVTNYLLTLGDDRLAMRPNIDTTKLLGGPYGKCHVEMNFLMAIYKDEIMKVGGFAEDMLGYAGEDSDFIERLKLSGLKHLRTDASAVHLFHGGHNDGTAHWDNPAWVYNYKIFQDRLAKKQIVVNIDKDWGKIDG